LKARGLLAAPEIAVGDGALGFWKALDEIFPATHHQRCLYEESQRGTWNPLCPSSVIAASMI
jgi:hypothetical protein